MARKPNVRNKSGYWYSEAGGKARRFGRCDEVSRAEALSRLWQAIADDEALVLCQAKDAHAQEQAALSPHVDEGLGVSSHTLTNAYLEWIKAHRSSALHREAKRHLERWNQLHGEMPCQTLDASHLLSFRETLLARGYAKLYVHKHETTVKAMMNRCIRLGLLPHGFKPFAHVDALHIPQKALLESDLPSPNEVKRLIANAKPEFAAMLKVYHATGARTHELIETHAGDYQRQSRMLVLSKHKRSSTLREYRPRTIYLNDIANAIINERCHELSHDSLIFPNRNGNQFTSCLLGDMFAMLRTQCKVREHITLYSFRHLWISDMLQAGHDALLVARMAGTSVKMIESVYGHFRSSSLASAQAIMDAMRQSHLY